MRGFVNGAVLSSIGWAALAWCAIAVGTWLGSPILSSTPRALAGSLAAIGGAVVVAVLWARSLNRATVPAREASLTPSRD